MVPLDQKNTVLDWMAELELPVADGGRQLSRQHQPHADGRRGAGRRRNATCAPIVVSETEGSHVPLFETVATIARFLPAVEVIALPRLAVGEEHPAFEQIAKSCGLV